MKIFKILLIILFLIIILLIPLKFINSQTISKRTNGYILLQVEKNGEAWYVNPTDSRRYYLGSPAKAFEIMKKLSLGAQHNFIAENIIFPAKVSGRILLDVEKNGEAYYIYPKNLKKYFLGRPNDAFNVMRNLGLGISNDDLAKIPTGNINNPQANKILIESVPFTSQAPLGEWSDQRQQDGCEEASALMAVKWAKKEKLSKEQAKNIILSASDYLLDKYGEYRDISAKNTLDWIFKDYFNYQNAYFKENITNENIIYELSKGNLIITPMDGQKLNNPNFTPPGPERHMLLIRGYDLSKNIFITNDPGTRNGELYQYDMDLFFSAIRDYPTGYHEPIDKIQKNMIIVWK